MRGTHWWSWLLVAACGGAEVAPDAEDLVQVPPHSVTVRVSGSGTPFLAYRDGEGPWQTPEQVSDTEYELRVWDAYVFVSACANESGFSSNIRALTWSEGYSSTWAYCGTGELPPEEEVVDVTGHMLQPGSVRLDDVASSETGPWDFSLSVRPGLHDVFALTSDRLLIRRGVSITAAGSIPDIDVVQDGLPLESEPVVFLGLDGDEMVTTELDWFATNSYVTLSRSWTEIVQPPTALVEPNDFYYVWISAETETTSRQAFTDFTGVETLYTMPPKLTEIEYIEQDGSLRASWSAEPNLPPDASVSIFLDGSDATHYEYQGMGASPGWSAATGTKALGFPTDIPGFDPAWLVDLDGPYTRSFEVWDWAGRISYINSVTEAVNGATVTRRERGSEVCPHSFDRERCRTSARAGWSGRHVGRPDDVSRRAIPSVSTPPGTEALTHAFP